MTVHVIDFSEPAGPVEHRRLADWPDRVVTGDPHHTTVGRYTDATGRLTAGTWTSTPGKWRAFTDREEFCHIVAGHVRLIADDGRVQDFTAGSAFLIPNGFRGYWEVVETTTKHYVVLDCAPRPLAG